MMAKLKEELHTLHVCQALFQFFCHPAYIATWDLLESFPMTKKIVYSDLENHAREYFWWQNQEIALEMKIEMLGGKLGEKNDSQKM